MNNRVMPRRADGHVFDDACFTHIPVKHFPGHRIFFFPHGDSAGRRCDDARGPPLSGGGKTMATPESSPNSKRLKLFWWKLDTCTTFPHTNLVTHDVRPGNQTSKEGYLYLESRLSTLTICLILLMRECGERLHNQIASMPLSIVWRCPTYANLRYRTKSKCATGGSIS